MDSHSAQTTHTTMKLTIATNTQAALETDLTVRCLHVVDYTADSRHSSVAIPWAETLVADFVGDMMEKMGHLRVSATAQLRLVDLENIPCRACIVYDIFLSEANDRLHCDLDGETNRPIHSVI